MSQTVTQNSALNQNWVECTMCTPWPSLHAQASRPAPRSTVSPLVVAVPRPCRSLWPAVSWSCRRPPRPYRDRVAARTRALLCAVSQHTAAVSPGVSQHTPAAKPLPSCHDTVICIVTRFANQTSRLSRYKDCIVTQPPATRPLSPVMIQNFVS